MCIAQRHSTSSCGAPQNNCHKIFFAICPRPAQGLHLGTLAASTFGGSATAPPAEVKSTEPAAEVHFMSGRQAGVAGDTDEQGVVGEKAPCATTAPDILPRKKVR